MSRGTTIKNVRLVAHVFYRLDGQHSRKLGYANFLPDKIVVDVW
jgi:hypothetical protein